MSKAELKIIAKSEKIEIVDDSADFSYIESFHPAVLKLLATSKFISRNSSSRAYAAQGKVHLNSGLRFRPNILINKKVS